MSPAIQLIVQRYLKSRAGRTGSGKRDLLFAFNDLLREAGCQHGTMRYDTIQELETLENGQFLALERHHRDASAILRVRLSPDKAERLIEHFGDSGPESQRRNFANLLMTQAEALLPTEFQEGWRQFCEQSALAASRGESVYPLDVTNPNMSMELLETTSKLLSWKGESYLRFASSVLCEDSKRLGQLKANIERLLASITQEKIRKLSDLGLTETGGGCWVHGPGVLISKRGKLDLNVLDLPAHFSKSDLSDSQLESTAICWLTVENESMLLELAKLHSGIMLFSSGFRGGVANSAVVNLLRGAPPDTTLYHFGDADPKGFDILRDLRERTGRSIHSIHMGYRPSSHSPALTAEELKMIHRLLGSEAMTTEEKEALKMMSEVGTKGRYEQESLGRPAASWPFY